MKRINNPLRGRSKTFQNRAILSSEGLVRITVKGDQNGKTARRVLYETQRLLDQLHDQDRPKLILVDFTQIGKETKESIRVAGHFTQLAYDRLAVFGLSPRLERIAQGLIAATGNTHRAKVFKTESAALEWLCRETEPTPAKPSRLLRLVRPFTVLLVLFPAVAG